jgi:hypothetical protein
MAQHSSVTNTTEVHQQRWKMMESHFAAISVPAKIDDGKGIFHSCSMSVTPIVL